MIGKTSAGTSAKEEKTVTAGTAQKVVTPSNGKLLSKVTINPTPSQAKTATPTAAQQTIKPDSGKLLSQVLVNAVPDSEKKGLYVWKKCSVQKELAETTKSNVYISVGASGGASYTYIYADSYSVDLDTGIFTLNNPQTYAGQVMYPPSALKGKYIIAVDASTGDTYTPKTSGNELWFIPSDATLTGGTGYGSADTVTSYKVNILKSVLDFFVSDDPTAYPDGGTQGGYWYEKVKSFMFGLTKEAHGSFIPSTDTTKYTLEHNLGAIPKFVVVYTNDSLKGHQYTVRSMMFVDRSSFDSTTTNNNLAMAELYNSASYSSFEVFNKSGETAPMGTFDENSLPLHKSSSNSFKAGATYYWQVMA